MKRIFIISLTCLTAILAGTTAAAAKKYESPGKLAKKHLELFQKIHSSDPEGALKAMETAIEHAAKAEKYELNNNEKALIYYIAAQQYNIVKGEDNTSWLYSAAYHGIHPGSKITDAGVALASADARIRLSRLLKPEKKGVHLVNAKLILDSIRASETDYFQSKSLAAIGFEVSPQTLDRLYAAYEDEVSRMTPEQWMEAAWQTVNKPDKPLDKTREDEFAVDLCAYACIQLAKAAGAPDAESLEGELLLSGKFRKYYPANKIKAREAFRRAAEKGGISGAVKTALFLIDEEKWQEAYDMVIGHQDNPDFNWQGGDYVLARTYESGAIDGKTWKDAYPLYSKTAPTSRFFSIMKDSQKRSEDLQARALAEETDQMVAKAGGISKMTPKELATVARRYQSLKRTEDAMKFWKAAADKGHAQACNNYAMLWCGVHDYKKDKGFKDVAPYFRKGAELGYYPAIANTVVVDLYGYGGKPNHDHAFSLYETLIETRDAENLEDFDAKEEFLSTISGTRYSEKGILNADHIKKAIAEHKDPAYLTMFGKARYKDSSPLIWQYYLKRAADMGHQPAKDFLHQAGVEGY